ncbi:tetratricopeptide repeat protein [Litoribaculum gwangyangense]|uniref:Tetratricopeptide repeat protein n=1 Tax=Litoribaculum gwangyangense TaxID=1130722 RepID=A0ABP9CKJ4_9FLAO
MRKNFILLIALCPIISLGQANKIFRQASRETDLSKKIELYTQVISLEPSNLDAYFYRAIAKNDLGDFSGAIVDYSKIIVEEPDADTYYNRGNSRYSLKDFLGAKDDYAKAYMLDKNFLDALYSLACVKFDLGEYEEAIEDLSSLLKISPELSHVYTLRGAAYKALEKYQNALKDYTAAIFINPSVDTYYNRGVFLMDVKYYEEANNDFKKVLRADRNNAYGYFYSGASNLFLGKFLNAIEDFSKALEFDSVDFDAYLGLAMAYNRINDIEKAKANFDKANAIISPNEAINTIEKYGNTYWYQNQYYYFNNQINELAGLR